MVPVRYRVVDRIVETPDTVTLALVPRDEPIARPIPGQFTMLYAFGAGEAAISVSGCPGTAAPLRHTIRASGVGTRALWAAAPGTTIGVRGPFGAGWPLPAAEGADVLVIGGGIGLAPLRPVVYAMLNARDRFRRISLLYGARTPADLLYAGELASWRARFDIEVEITVDGAGEEWRGDVGVVSSLIPRAPFDPADAVAMIVGPEIMMRFTIAALRERGLSEDRIFLSMERNMRCAIGFCGHCQLGPTFVCKDGPVFSYREIGPWIGRREV